MKFARDCIVYTKEGCLVNPNIHLISARGQPFAPDHVALITEYNKLLKVTSRYGTFLLDTAGYVAVFEDITKIKLKPVSELTINDLLVNIPYRHKNNDDTSWKVWWLRGYAWAAGDYSTIRLPVDTPYRLLVTDALYELGLYTAFAEAERTIKWYFNSSLDTEPETIIGLNDTALRAFLAGAHFGSPWRPDCQEHQMALHAIKTKLDLAQKMYMRLGIHTTIRYGKTGTVMVPKSRVKRREAWLSVESRLCQQLWLARIGGFLADEAFSLLKAMRVTHSVPSEMVLKHAKLSRTTAKVDEKYLEWEKVIQRYRVPNCWLPVPIKHIEPVSTSITVEIKAAQPFLVDGLLVASSFGGHDEII